MDKNRAGLKDQQTKARPKLSICIPTYNRAVYLEKALSNFVAPEMFPFDWEIVISDNCSTDETAKVVAKFTAQCDRIRYYKQDRNKGPLANMISAFRLAIGEFAVYLADDDALIPDAVVSIVRYMDQNPNISVCFSPFEYWNDATKQSEFLSHVLEKDTIFKREDAVDLFNLIIHRYVYPEIALYRTNALHNSLYPTHTVHMLFLTLARLFQCGDVAFLSSAFYRYIGVHWEGETRNQVGIEWGLPQPDIYRGGIECLLYKAFRSQGHASVPVEQRDSARQMINSYFVKHLYGNMRYISQKNEDYVGANDFLWRLLPYDFIPATELLNYRQFLAPRAAAQSLIETFEAMTWLEYIGLYHVSDSSAVETLLKGIRKGLPVRPISDGEVYELRDKDKMLVLVGNNVEREKLLQAGFQSGLVVVEQELVSQFMP